MVRKGKISEIFSRAIHSDNPELYSIGYIDFGKIKEVPITEFLKLSENFEIIPASRISYIKRENTILYSKFHAEEDSAVSFS
ncbi:MAG: DUF504 domain-containing protein [Nitrososphaera sp.]|jgi:hypothetical protein